jgi:hypothetical protein
MYEVTFDAMWNAQDHPYDFPDTPHFSGLIGGTHKSTVSFWRPGGIASQGIENMAELGSKFPLNDEVAAAVQAGDAFNVLSGGGIPLSPARVQLTFEADSQYPLITLVSMIAPSPDWFVGVHDFNLMPSGSWLNKAVIDLFPYDAGTDHGTTFEAPDSDTVPQIPISPITSFPFDGTPRVGTFTFLRLIPGDTNRSGELDLEDINLLTRAIQENLTDPLFDLDKNGSIDAADRQYWVRDLKRTYFGDANLDGQFNSGDLVDVFQANHYEDTITLNSDWSTGDWNGDGDFTSRDLVLAFQDGGYESGPRLAAAVPEPHSVTSLAIGLLLVAGKLIRRK